MGYNIKVDHSKFEATASKIDAFNSKFNSKMTNADNAMMLLFSSWQGVDATEFKKKWNTINGSDSTYVHMKKSLESYASFLRSAGNKYRNAQADAVNRANNLPKW